MPKTGVRPYETQQGRRWLAYYRKDGKQVLKRGFRTARQAERWRAHAMLNADPMLLEALYIDRPMDEQTPLKIAANMAETGVFNLLLDRGADINGQVTLPSGGNGASTVLHGAVYSGSVEMVRLALDRGADVSLTNSWGATPLGTNWLSRRRTNAPEISEILIAHGANPEDQPRGELIH